MFKVKVSKIAGAVNRISENAVTLPQPGGVPSRNWIVLSFANATLKA
jgi:hypothetical protein